MKIIAYGSRIRGDYSGDSDLDILVVVDKKDKGLKDKILGIFYSYEIETVFYNKSGHLVKRIDL